MSSVMASETTWMFSFPSSVWDFGTGVLHGNRQRKSRRDVLTLLYLTTFKDKPGGHGKVTTGIPSIASIKGATATKAKSVLLTEKGGKRSQVLFEKHFMK